MFQDNPYALAAVIASLIAFALTGVSIGRRNSSGAKSLTAMMFAVGFWAAMYALEMAVSDPQAQVFWSKMQYFGITTVPVFWIIFALRFNNPSTKLTIPQVIVLFLLPLLTITLVWTNEAHRLIWPSTVQVLVGNALITDYSHGSMFWVHSGYSYVLLLAGTIALVRRAIAEKSLYRNQIALVVIGALIMWIVNLGYLLGLSPFPALDVTPFAFIISGFIFIFAFTRYNMLAIVSLDPGLILDGLTDGIMVLDPDHNVLFFNPSFRFITGISDLAIGRKVFDVLPTWLTINPQFLEINAGKREMTARPEKATTELFEIQIVPLLDEREQLKGRILALRDVSGRQGSDLPMRTDGFGVLMMAMDSKTGAIMDANSSLMAYSGLRLDQLVGKTPLQVGLWSIPERVQFLNAYNKEGGRLAGHPMSVSTRFGDQQPCTVYASKMQIGRNEAIIWAAMLGEKEETPAV